jgi:dTDP-4-dehydrorhamnose reductase
MKILITGSNGQLGNELASMLKTGEAGIGKISEQYKDCEVIAVDVDTLDITDYSAVDKFVSDSKPDIIINCAAMTNVDGCETNFDAAMKVNAIGPRNLAMAAEKCGSKLVHISTDYVFSGDGSTPRCEWDTVGPETVYGKSKLLGEKYVENFSKKYFIIRTAWLYGVEGNNFVKTMRRLGNTNEVTTVVDDQRGNPTNANDLAYHILKLAVTEEYGIYHCTGEGECSWAEFAALIMELSGCKGKVAKCTTQEYSQKYPASAPRPLYSSLDNLMLKCTVGNEMRDWQTALKEYITKLDEMEKNQ